MADRRTRDQLRHSNDKLRAAIRAFVKVQDEFLSWYPPDVRVPAEWMKAYKRMKSLMGETANLPASTRVREPQTRNVANGSHAKWCRCSVCDPSPGVR